MGSRYGGDFRRSDDWTGSRGGPPAPPRWDAERFVREREGRVRAAPPVVERERFEFEKDRLPRGGGFEERYFAEERYGPPARRPDRRYYEEDTFVETRRPPPADAMIPYRPRREEPPRPGLLRRQSSLDTFDRRPHRHYDEFDDARTIAVPLPPRRPSPPRYAPRYSERDFEEIRVAEPDYYGDEEFRTFKEREWRRTRRRSTSSEVRERFSEENVSEEAPWPRRGKTKMPRSKIHLKAIVDLGYPFEEEGETIVLLKALNKQQIDQVIALSQEYKDREQVTTTTTTIHVLDPPQPREEVVTVPMSEAPRSVREWDTLRVEPRAPSPTRTRRSRSHHSRARSRRGSSPEMVVEKREIIREVSPARTVRTRRPSRSRASSPSILERREIIEIDNGDESNSVHAGPLPLVLQERRRRTERDLKDEIRALEEERRVLRYERGTRDREVIIERERPEEVVEVRKDKKAPPPDPRLIRAMMATLT